MSPKMAPQVVLQPDFESVFKPFNIIQALFCLKTYNLKNGIAKPLNKIDIVTTFIANNIIIASFTVTMQLTTFGNPTTENIYCWTYSQYVTWFSITSILNYYHSSKNFELLSKLQQVGRVIRNSADTKRLKYLSWGACSLLVAFYVHLVVLKLCSDRYNWHWSRALYVSTTIIFEVKIVNLTMLIYYLTCKLRKWELLVTKFTKEYRYDFFRSEFLEVFKNMMLIFYYVNEVSKILVMLHFVMTFFQSLLYIEILLIWTKSEPNVYDFLIDHIMSVVLWIFKGFVIELFLCLSCELFYREVEMVRVKIITKYSKEYHRNRSNEQLINFGKSIVRVSNTNFFKMSACGMFTVDATLPLRFGSLVTVYTLVLLQFEL